MSEMPANLVLCALRACSQYVRLARVVALMPVVAIAPLCGQDIHPWLAGSGSAIYYDGGNVGIGTTSPYAPLDITVTGGANDLRLGQYIGRRTTGTAAAGMGVSSRFYLQDAAGSFIETNGIASSWVDASAGNRYARMDFYSSKNNTASIAMSVDQNGNVGVGTTNPTQKLSVNGTIRTKEVVVDAGWADYVFEPAYRVRPLAEVNAYIQQHRRLPDMPSAEEVREKGVGVGEMQVKLLAKIEELTLQMIQMDRQNKKLQARLAGLESQISRAGVRAKAPGF